MAKGLMDVETWFKTDEIMRIFRTAVRKAQAENRRLGISNVFSIRGKLYYELPNGDLTRTDPDAPQEESA